jgi:fructose-bisphosphate aldolase class I
MSSKDYPVPFIPSHQFHDELIATAKKICTPGKGILAADESTGTIAKRFQDYGIPLSRANRRDYRKMLFTAPGMNKYISGVITYEETLFEKLEDGTDLIQTLKDQGVMVGIKVDLGTKPLPGTKDETYTQGLTDLDIRCKKYYAHGARFAKWRAVLKISPCDPSPLSIKENSETLAKYAAICQANGLVPIVEPEILMDGSHSLAINQYWTEKVLAACYKALNEHNVLLEGTLLKPNMCLPGAQFPQKATSFQIAQATVTALQRTVPPAMPGVVFLSGGMTEEQATVNLNALNSYNKGKKPWTLTFSYGRALQQSALDAWRGKAENFSAGQQAFLVRARANGLAQLGKYAGDAANQGAAAKSLYVKDYKY